MKLPLQCLRLLRGPRGSRARLTSVLSQIQTICLPHPLYPLQGSLCSPEMFLSLPHCNSSRAFKTGTNHIPETTDSALRNVAVAQLSAFLQLVYKVGLGGDGKTSDKNPIRSFRVSVVALFNPDFSHSCTSQMFLMRQCWCISRQPVTDWSSLKGGINTLATALERFSIDRKK